MKRRLRSKAGKGLAGMSANPPPRRMALVQLHVLRTARLRKKSRKSLKRLDGEARSARDRPPRLACSTTQRDPLTYSPLQGRVRSHSNINSQTQYLSTRVSAAHWASATALPFSNVFFRNGVKRTTPNA